MKIDYQDRIDSYVQGEMTADERKAFEQEVQNDEELRDQLEYTKQVKSRITSRQEKMALLKQWEEERQMEERRLASSAEPVQQSATPVASAKMSSKKMFYWISGIAAMFIVGFFGISLFFMNTDNSDDIERGGDGVFVPNDTINKTPVTSESTDSLNVEP